MLVVARIRKRERERQTAYGNYGGGGDSIIDIIIFFYFPFASSKQLPAGKIGVNGHTHTYTLAPIVSKWGFNEFRQQCQK